MTPGGANEVTAAVERLAGIDKTFAIEEGIRPGTFRVHAGLRFFLATKVQGAWMVEEHRDNGPTGRTWSEHEDPTVTRSVAQLVAMICNQPVQAVVFKHVLTEPDGTRRQLYDTRAGDVRLHTRKVGLDTETCIEFLEHGDIFHWMWRADSSSIDVSKVKRVSSAPF